MDLLRLARRRGSLVVADMPVSTLGLLDLGFQRSSSDEDGTAVAEDDEMDMHKDKDMQRDNKFKQQRQTPTVFQEPDASALLDSFGF